MHWSLTWTCWLMAMFMFFFLGKGPQIIFKTRSSIEQPNKKGNYNLVPREPTNPSSQRELTARCRYRRRHSHAEPVRPCRPRADWTWTRSHQFVCFIDALTNIWLHHCYVNDEPLIHSSPLKVYFISSFCTVCWSWISALTFWCQVPNIWFQIYMLPVRLACVVIA